jgi:acetyltransferase-like isoleucine patch superfamily enzyme
MMLSFVSRLKRFLKDKFPIPDSRLLDVQKHPKAVLHDTCRIQNLLKNPQAIQIGAYSHIRGELLTYAHGGKITIGDYCFVGENTHIWSAKEIKIGHRTLIAHDVNIFDSINHPLDPIDRHEQFKAIITKGHPQEIFLEEEPVIIEEDVQIGARAIIHRGVRIGQGSLIGAGAVVTQSFPPFSIISGNPARVFSQVPKELRNIPVYQAQE